MSLLVPEYRHPEAFCLMQYKDEVTGEIEIVWNSRDGVTPFMIPSRRGNNSVHCNWRNDIRAVNFRPAPGMRIFVDIEPRMILANTINYVNLHWDLHLHPFYMPMRYSFKTKEEAIKALIDADCRTGAPWLVEIS